MIKEATTGEELAHLYVLEAAGVPEHLQSENTPQNASYLYDTKQGRKLLLNTAKDILNNIRSINDDALQSYYDNHINEVQPPEWNDISQNPQKLELEIAPEARKHIRKRMTEFGLLQPDEAPEDQLELFSSIKTAQLNEPRPDDETDARIWAFLKEMYTYGTQEHILKKIWNTWKQISSEMGREFALNYMSDMIPREIANDPWFLQEYYDTIYVPKEYPEAQRLENRDAIFEELAPDMMGDPHFDIEMSLRNLANDINKAESSGDRRDYQDIMGTIDELSSLSHHGGPAFEYADTTYKPLGKRNPPSRPDMMDVVNRKFGERFVPWALANDLLPTKLRDDVKAWYDEKISQESRNAFINDLRSKDRPDDKPGEAYNRAHSAEDYYTHPRFSEPNKWYAEHSPTFREWTPFSAEREHLHNVHSLYDAAEYNTSMPDDRRWVIEEFADQYDDGKKRLDPFEPRPKWASSIEDMVKTAAKLDRLGHPDLVDRMDRIARQLPSGVEVQTTEDAISRMGIPPHLLQVMELQHGQPNMNAPLYQIPEERMQSLHNILPGVEGVLFDATDVDPAFMRRFRENMGIHYDEPSNHFIITKKPPSPFDIIHEGTHARGGEIQQQRKDYDDKTLLGNATYLLSNAEMEAELNNIIFALYNKPSQNFANYFHQRKKDHPKQEIGKANWLTLHNTLWNVAREFAEENGIYELAKNKQNIINEAKNQFIKESMINIFQSHTPRHQEKSIKFALELLKRDVISNEQYEWIIDHIHEQKEQEQD